jgi:predicted transcriptional regulator
MYANLTTEFGVKERLMSTAAQGAEELTAVTTKASDLFVRALEAEGVEHIFAVPE